MAKIYHSVFPNGLRFYARPMPGTRAATIFVVFQVGSRYETDQVAGMSHFLEHMIFKGTKKRPTPRIVARELDNLGAEYNAFTSKDWTGYYIKSSEDFFDKGLEVMGDVLLNSRFAPSATKRERTVILEEMRMYEDNPLFHIEDIFEQTVFGKTPLGREIAGYRKSVLATTSAKLRKYWQTYYHPRNMAVVVTGAVDAKKVEKKIKKMFGGMRPRRRLPFFSCRYHQNDPQVVLLNKKVEQTQIALGFPAYDYEHPQLPVLEVIHGILGSGMSSRLFEKIREQMGLAYSVRTSIVSYEDAGAFFVRAGLDSAKTVASIRAILLELSRFKRSLVSNEELKRAKQFLAGNLALQLERSDTYAGWLAKQALFLPKIISVEESIQRIYSVTKSQVRDVASDVMQPSKLNLAIIGPQKSAKPFENLLRKFK